MSIVNKIKDITFMYCPFCGNTPTRKSVAEKVDDVVIKGKRDTHYKLICKCGIQTKYYKSIDELVIKWNARSVRDK